MEHELSRSFLNLCTISKLFKFCLNLVPLSFNDSNMLLTKNAWLLLHSNNSTCMEDQINRSNLTQEIIMNSHNVYV